VPVKLRDALQLGRVGPGTGAELLREGLWHRKTFLGLRCDLTRLPEVRPARLALTMQPEPLASFSGFEEELRRSSGRDSVELLLRIQSCESGVSTLYVARAEDGRPAYAQWLIRPQEQERLHAHAPGSYAPLGGDEVLLEGAYTFGEFRRLGLMADGMAQLLRYAREEGFRSAITYVATTNVASLRGCAACGFEPDHVRISERRLGRRRSRPEPLSPQARSAWAEALGL
jgi:RimJ/RimL family protein N-acetyltransferase